MELVSLGNEGMCVCVPKINRVEIRRSGEGVMEGHSYRLMLQNPENGLLAFVP